MDKVQKHDLPSATIHHRQNLSEFIDTEVQIAKILSSE
jgi:hypothetical protein